MRPRGVKRLFAFSSRTHDEVRADISEEFQFHLDMRIDALRREGLSDADARAQALREFGNQTSGAAACARHDDRVERRRRLSQFIAEFRQDAAIGVRLLRSSPGFALVAILTLALGIGANTAIFGALDAVLLRPLAYPAPDRLVEVRETREEGQPNSVAGGVFLDWHDHQTHFAAMALVNRVAYNLRGRSTPERVTGVEASHELLQVLGISPLLGRGFIADDDRPGGRNDVVMLSEELWRSRFGGDPSIVGRSIVLDEVPRTVIGVLPRGAWLFPDQLFVVPAVLQPGTSRAQRAPHWAMVLGRLKPESSIAQAEAELKTIKQQLARDYPKFKEKWGSTIRPMAELVSGPSRPPLLILLGAVSLVLLVACANVANLLLARACNREPEIALRAALGATRGRIVRQVLTESLVLALLGGIAGLAIAYWGAQLLQVLTAKLAPGAPPPQLDGRVLVFSLILTAATGLLFGLFPALRARKPDLNDTLKNGGRTASAGGRQRAQSTLIVAEVALTVVLLVCAGLLLRSLANTASVDPGFEPSRVLAFDLSLPETTYDADEKTLAYSAQLLARLRALPGVDGAGAGMSIPFSGGGFGEYFDRPGSDQRGEVIGRVDYVSPGYLEALGTRLVAGRLFTDADNQPKGERVAIISASTVRAFFSDKDAIGQQLIVSGTPWRIVGVLADKVDLQLDSARQPFAYVPQALNPHGFSIAVRASVPPMTLVTSVQRELQRLDPGVAMANPRALDQAMAGSMVQQRMVLTLVGTFAAVALLLASIGLYGVMAYSVVTRRREICIRMALGAERHAVLQHVLRDGVRLVTVGLAIGIAGALAATQLLASQLFEVNSYDPLVVAGTITAIAVVALIACWLPAVRATRFDPISALRAD